MYHFNYVIIFITYITLCYTFYEYNNKQCTYYLQNISMFYIYEIIIDVKWYNNVIFLLKSSSHRQLFFLY